MNNLEERVKKCLEQDQKALENKVSELRKQIGGQDEKKDGDKKDVYKIKKKVQLFDF